MRRSPNIIYVGDTVTCDGVMRPVTRVGPDGFDVADCIPLPYEFLRTASPVQGHQSGRGDAAREGDGT